MYIIICVYIIYSGECVCTHLNSCSRFSTLPLGPAVPPRARSVCPSAVNRFSAQRRHNPSRTAEMQTGARVPGCAYMYVYSGGRRVCVPDKSNRERNFAGFPWENHTGRIVQKLCAKWYAQITADQYSSYNTYTYIVYRIVNVQNVLHKIPNMFYSKFPMHLKS